MMDGMSTAIDVVHLAAWTLASPWMLLWGIAAVIPIIIHLWSRRRQREIHWAAMDFLMSAMRRHARRIRIEQLVLLLLRCSILLLFCVALANPLVTGLPAGLAAVGKSSNMHHLLILDGSYSMAGSNDRTTFFATAKKHATEYVERCQPGDGFTLLLMTDSPEVIIGELAFDASDVANEINRLQQQHGGGDLASTLATASELIESVKSRNPRLLYHQVCFFTDLGATTWDYAATPAGRRQLDELSDSASMLVDVLGEPISGNAAVQVLVNRETALAVGRDAILEVHVQKFGAGNSQRRLELLIDGRVVEDQVVDLNSADRAVRSFVHRFDAPGLHTVEARLGEDALVIDNHRWLVVSIPERIRILCVEGRPGAADFIRIALAPDAESSLFDVDVVTESGLLDLDLNTYASVWLCNVGRLGRDESIALGEYVRAGGGLVTILGDQVDTDILNTNLGNGQSGPSLLPAALGEVVGESISHFDPLEYHHPIVQPFRDFQKSGLVTTPVWRHVRVTPEPGSEVALAFNNGDPAIVTAMVGKGRSILMTTAASSSSVDGSVDPVVPWSAIVAWPSFPPLIQEMARYAMGGQDRQHNVRVGDSLRVRANATSPAEKLTVRTPDLREVEQSDPAQGFWAFSETEQSGIYRLTPSETPLPIPFAVNIEPRESDPTRVDLASLSSKFQSLSSDNSSSGSPVDTASPAEAFRLVLTGVFVLLCTELWLAWWFGRDAR